jgi:hypothetical protein
VPLIHVLPKHYRAIVLETLAAFPGATVWVETVRCDDLSEDGALVQRTIMRMRNFEIRTADGAPILGFHDHPREMWVDAEFRQLAERLRDLGHLKIERSARHRSAATRDQGSVDHTPLSTWGIGSSVLLAAAFALSLYRNNYGSGMTPSTWNTANHLSAALGFAAVICGSVAMHRQSGLWLLIVLPALFLALAGYLGHF